MLALTATPTRSGRACSSGSAAGPARSAAQTSSRAGSGAVPLRGSPRRSARRLLTPTGRPARECAPARAPPPHTPRHRPCPSSIIADRSLLALPTHRRRSAVAGEPAALQQGWSRWSRWRRRSSPCSSPAARASAPRAEGVGRARWRSQQGPPRAAKRASPREPRGPLHRSQAPLCTADHPSWPYT